MVRAEAAYAWSDAPQPCLWALRCWAAEADAAAAAEARRLPNDIHVPPFSLPPMRTD